MTNFDPVEAKVFNSAKKGNVTMQKMWWSIISESFYIGYDVERKDLAEKLGLKVILVSSGWIIIK